MKNNKKAQIQGQIFIYILTVIIAGFIFVFGYNAIISFTEQIEISKLIDFEVEMKNTFSRIGSEYQSFEKHKFVLPSDYEKICFLNLDFVTTSHLAGYPLIIDSLASGVKDNVFIYSNWLEKSLDVGDIKILNNTCSDSSPEVAFNCITLFNGKFYLNIRGLGDKPEIEEDKECLT